MEEEKKEYWSIEELVQLTETVQEGEFDYKGKSIKFQWCELSESEEPKFLTELDNMSEEEKNAHFMEVGKLRSMSMIKKAEDKNPDGPKLSSAWNKLPSTLKYQITNVMMGVSDEESAPNL